MAILAEDNRNDPFSGTIGGSNETATSGELAGGGGADTTSPGSRANTSGGMLSGVTLIEEQPNNLLPLIVGLITIKYLGWI